MNSFEVRFRRRPTEVTRVRAGAGILASIGDDLAGHFPGRPAFLVTDSNVAPIHAAAVAAVLERRGIPAPILDFPAGERSKSRETKAALEDRLLDLGARRDAVLVAVGGGVAGDLAGFVAATWHRGVPVLQVPTSLLAMVDAALGGKTAVDLPSGKNLVGAFHQPWGVYADVETLRTLSEADFRNGLAEVVKSAVVADARLFRRLERGAEQLVGRSAEALEETVLACLAIKARVVTRDERESGRRAALNFGHTVAHALEAASDWSLPHGAAVAIGCALEARLAVERTGLSARAAVRIDTLLRTLGLDTGWPEGCDVERAVGATRRDKKVRGGEVRYALPVRIGAMPHGEDVTVAVPDDALRRAIEEHRRGPARLD